MPYRHLLALILLFAGSWSLAAKEITATLQSSSRDKVTIRYDVSSRDGSMQIRFTSVRKQLSMEHSNKYDKPDYIKVLFFDKTGGFSEDVFRSDITTEALAIPSDKLRYSYSTEGYVWLDELPQLNAQLLVPQATLSIPIYLAYYKKKHTYEVFARCGTLDIVLEDTPVNDDNGKSGLDKRTRTITQYEEVEVDSELDNTEIANNIVGEIEKIMATGPATQIPEGLDFYVNKLRELEYTITDRTAKQKIGDVLKRVSDWKQEVKQAGQDEADGEARKNSEREARNNLAYLNERLDSIDKLTDSDIAEMKSVANELRRQSHAVDNPELAREMKSAADRCDTEVKKMDDAKKRRNIWMIIGMILLGILMFVGNQLFQHFRNLRNQKRMEDMQNKMVNRAQTEAKLRARNMVRSKVNRAQNAARQKTRDAVRNSVKKGIDNIAKGKGGKRFSV